jgi:hypothetical protein
MTTIIEAGPRPAQPDKNAAYMSFATLIGNAVAFERNPWRGNGLPVEEGLRRNIAVMIRQFLSNHGQVALFQLMEDNEDIILLNTNGVAALRPHVEAVLAEQQSSDQTGA